MAKATGKARGQLGKAGGNGAAAVQYAALPVRRGPGGIEVLMVTSRETRRWIVPKGWAEPGLDPHTLAAREAWEEAGIRGQVAEEPFGTYRYGKRLTHGKSVTCHVSVFLLAVEEELADWPERAERDRRWFTAGQAAMACGEPGLVAILLRVGLLGS